MYYHYNLSLLDKVLATLMEENKLTNEELEEQGLLEVCGHCGSLHVTVEDQNTKYCNSCGIVNFTEVISEDEYVKRNQVNC